MNTISCDECGKRFKLRIQLKKHKDDKHSGRFEKKNEDKCQADSPSSNQDFSNPTVALEPISDPPLNTEQPVLISESLSRNEEFSIENQKNPSTNQCNVCNKVLCNKRSLKVHMEIHTSSKRYSCDKCTQSFTTPGNLGTHKKKKNCYTLVNAHLKEARGREIQSCEVCNKTFKTKRNKKRHMICHSNEMPYGCKLCTKTFKRAEGIQRHSCATLTNCQYCPETFKNQYLFKKHLSAEHAEKIAAMGKEGINTEEMGKAQRINVVHEIIVQKDEKIGRKKREYSFIPKGNKFNKERLFTCDTCNASFVNNTNLTRHQQVHSDERPFGCVYCDKEFKRKSTLKTHVKIGHPGKEFNYSDNRKKQAPASGSGRSTPSLPASSLSGRSTPALLPVSLSRKSSLALSSISSVVTSTPIPLVGKTKGSFDDNKTGPYGSNKTGSYDINKTGSINVNESYDKNAEESHDKNVRELCASAINTDKPDDKVDVEDDGTGEIQKTGFKNVLNDSETDEEKDETCMVNVKESNVLVPEDFKVANIIEVVSESFGGEIKDEGQEDDKDALCIAKLENISEDKSRRFNCSHCQISFSREYTMIRHIRNVHTNAKKFSCKFCTKCYGYKSNLKRHLISSHTMSSQDVTKYLSEEYGEGKIDTVQIKSEENQGNERDSKYKVSGNGHDPSYIVSGNGRDTNSTLEEDLYISDSDQSMDEPLSGSHKSQMQKKDSLKDVREVFQNRKEGIKGSYKSKDCREESHRSKRDRGDSYKSRDYDEDSQKSKRERRDSYKSKRGRNDSHHKGSIEKDSDMEIVDSHKRKRERKDSHKSRHGRKDSHKIKRNRKDSHKSKRVRKDSHTSKRERKNSHEGIDAHKQSTRDKVEPMEEDERDVVHNQNPSRENNPAREDYQTPVREDYPARKPNPARDGYPVTCVVL